ncbi:MULTISPECIES: S8 family peptidase [unclassified Flavobacterium]|uniref:S8 family peptidase n=1 Tax=unclassified Flavobacterium TaxID=196869 RepID=UPI00131C7C33|nr:MULTISPECIES: S8 family peptidase [unclassified Flavobacterium]
MKTKLTLLSIILPLILFSQSAEKWKQFIREKKMDTTASFYLSETKNAILNNCKIEKKLDNKFSVISFSRNLIKDPNLTLYPVNNMWKLPNNLKKHSSKKKYTIVSKDIKTLTEKLKSLKIENTVQSDLVFLNTDYKTLVNLIIPIQNVTSITQESFTPIVESKIIDQNFSLNQINMLSKNFADVCGSDQIVSIKDEFFDINDIDLLNKHIPSNTQSKQVSKHATAMATIVAGLANSSILGKGVAPKAKIQSSNFLFLFPDEYTSLQGATIQNHSYGTVIENFYGTLAAAFDKNLYEDTIINHIFSAGNRGTVGYKSITGNFKQSKNSIVVGSIDANENSMAFSSKGPAYDGRIKPEIVAYSTEGTSNSTAIVSGIISLMKELHNKINTTPLQNSTTKAILINSAKDLGNMGPDFTYGYGNVNALKCLNTIQNKRIITGSINSEQKNLHQISVPSNSENLKITLAWTDPPAPVNSNICLINDLDLALISPTETFLPWILNQDLPQLHASKGIDKVNTVEQIELKNLQYQTYTISVSSSILNTNSQNYSIVYDYDLKNKFEWNYPIENDNFPIDGRTISPIKWSSTITGTNGELSISYNDGLTWELIKTNINLQNEQYLYLPLQELFTRAKLKMKIGNEEFLSDSFIISYDLNTTTSLVCNGTTEINWSKPSNVSSFNIYELIYDSLQLKEQVTGTSYTYTNGKNHAVAPFFENTEGIKSESTFRYENNSNCYFELTSAEITTKNQITVSANLFSLFQIKRVELIKITNNKEVIIEIINKPNAKNFTFFDSNPAEGFNKYNIRLVLEDNSEINSKAIDIIFMGTNDFFVFPTILKTNQDINIETKTEEESSFYLFNLNGQNTVSQSFTTKSNSITLPSLSSGIYIYKITSKTGKNKTGKISIQ